MEIEVPSYIFKYQRYLSPNAFNLLLYIHTTIQPKDSFRLNHEDIAWHCNIPEEEIDKAIQELLEYELILARNKGEDIYSKKIS